MNRSDTTPAWRLSAVDLAAGIRAGELSAREATESVLARIAQVNPRINALTWVMTEQALAAADDADRARARGESLGPLHGVPVTIKINVDVAASPSDGGIVAFKDLIADSDAPLVANLKRAGAVIVGRSNAPCFSLRWFTDNDLHGRTLNPWDARATPGGSSGGAAAAVATGMGPIAHGNDYGGSIRHPAWACGVVGLRTTAGRVPAFNPTAKAERIVTNQLMSVNGPLTRTVADARLAYEAMAQGDARDPLWVPAPFSYKPDGRPLRVALFDRNPAGAVHPSVAAGLRQAGDWLADAGCMVERAEPPDFGEAAVLWRRLLADDMRRGAAQAIQTWGDAPVRFAFDVYGAGHPAWDRDGYLAALDRRMTIARAWSLFLDRFDVLVMPVSWDRQPPIDEDWRSVDACEAVIAANAPLTSTSMLGLPGLAVPIGITDGLPTGVQLVATRFREDRCLAAGEIIERASGFTALNHLAG
jgi:amidase